MLGYLQANENPNAPVRADGRRYWGHPKRSRPAQVIVIHTAETSPTTTSAEAVADYFTHSTRAASYHEIGDSNSFVFLLPREAVAFGSRGWNTLGWHWSFATRAHLWGEGTEWDAAALAVGARRCAEAASALDIPVQQITRAQAEQGARGFIGHGALDPSRRTDPGQGFPWRRFLDLVDAETEDDMATPGDTWNYISPVDGRSMEYRQRRGSDAAQQAAAELAVIRAEVETIAERGGVPVAELAQEIADRLGTPGETDPQRIVDALADRLRRDDA